MVKRVRFATRELHTPPKTVSLTKSTRKRLEYGSGSEEEWPEHIKAIFVDGLRAYWDSHWDTNSGSRSRWRDHYLVDYLQEKGITRSNKQVASYLQVLRNVWQGEPEYHLVDGIDEVLKDFWPSPSSTPPVNSEQIQLPPPDFSRRLSASDVMAKPPLGRIPSSHLHPTLSHPPIQNSKLQPENNKSKSIQNQHEHRDTPSEIYHNETIHTNSHNTTTTTNSNSHNVNITNVHHHHYHEPKQRRWSITKFVHQIVTVCVPVFWYPHSSMHHVPHSSFGGVNGWWEWIWTQCGWQWGWRWGG
ncbi:hypothetical protein PQX77_012006 [Marasmius sp. AFHP31]|nr:hypothetical protein PQX77_012006 [Marasmius sp. AFHP31]